MSRSTSLIILNGAGSPYWKPRLRRALAAVRQKDLRRQGLLLDDEALLQAMEPAEGTPRYLPYSVKKDGRSGDLASPAQLALLRQHVRRLLAGMYPDFFFREIPVGELGKTDVSGWKKPFILKPSVGFFSLGVYTITSDDDWTAAVADIERNLRESRDRFPESVVDQSSFLVEEYITGEEFAVDVYFDGEGEPIILNIFTHRFASLSDVSDRLYYTGKDVIEANKARFEAFFRKVNALMGIRDFPAHVELRVEGDRILPIEFNAMRFAGLCTTDMAYFAFGINTVDCYLNDRKPDFDAILRGRGGKIYSMVILDKPKSLPPSSAFDYDRLAAHFAKVLELRKVDVPELPVFGFAFTESDAERTEELDTILQSDLTEFLR